MLDLRLSSACLWLSQATEEQEARRASAYFSERYSPEVCFLLCASGKELPFSTTVVNHTKAYVAGPQETKGEPLKDLNMCVSKWLDSLTYLNGMQESPTPEGYRCYHSFSNNQTSDWDESAFFDWFIPLRAESDQETTIDKISVLKFLSLSCKADIQNFAKDHNITYGKALGEYTSILIQFMHGQNLDRLEQEKMQHTSQTLEWNWDTWWDAEQDHGCKWWENQEDGEEQRETWWEGEQDEAKTRPNISASTLQTFYPARRSPAEQTTTCVAAILPKHAHPKPSASCARVSFAEESPKSIPNLQIEKRFRKRHAGKMRPSASSCPVKVRTLLPKLIWTSAIAGSRADTGSPLLATSFPWLIIMCAIIYLLFRKHTFLKQLIIIALKRIPIEDTVQSNCSVKYW